MLINGVVLKKKTLYLLGVIASGTLTVQQTWVKGHVIPLLANHPHLSTIGGGLLVMLALIHNPVVQQFFGSNGVPAAKAGDPVVGVVSAAGNNLNTTPKDPQMKSAGKMLAGFGMVALLGGTTALLTGCPSQSIDALLATTAGAAFSGYLDSQGNTAGAAKATQLFGILSDDVRNLQPGSNSSLAQQAAIDLTNFLTALDPGSAPVAEIDIALQTVVGIMSDFGTAPPVAATATLQAHAKRVAVPTPKTAAQFKAQWNAIPGNPAPIK